MGMSGAEHEVLTKRKSNASKIRQMRQQVSSVWHEHLILNRAQFWNKNPRRCALQRIAENQKEFIVSLYVFEIDARF